jgi:P-type Ca2+ transporter type 2C
MILVLVAAAVVSGLLGEPADTLAIVVTALCLTQLANVLAIRSETQSLFRIGLFSDKYVLGAVVLTFLLQMATLYVPFLNPVFRTQPLTAGELTLVVALSSVIFFAVEVEKFFWRRRSRKDSLRV